MRKIVTITIFCAIALLIIEPTRYINVFANALQVWGLNILPVMLPFLTATAIINNQKDKEKVSKGIKYCKRQVGKAFLLSAICGYPIGAQQLEQLHDSHILSQRQTTHIAPLLSHPSIIFAIVTVGTTILESTITGIVIYICTILSSIVCAIVFYKMTNTCKTALYYEKFPTISSHKDLQLYRQNPLPNALSQNIVKNSVETVLFIGANIAIFAIICEMIKSVCESFTFDTANLFYVFGLLELTNGCLSTITLPTVWRSAACCCIVTFGGLCVLCQSLPYYKKCNIKAAYVVLAKLFQAAISLVFFFAFYALGVLPS